MTRSGRRLRNTLTAQLRGVSTRIRGRSLRRSATLLIVFTLVTAAVAVGLARLSTDTTPGAFLPRDDPSIEALEASARSFGGDPIVVLIESARPRELLRQEEVPKLIGLEGALTRLPDVAVVYGPGTIINQIAGAAQEFLATLSGARDAVRAEAEARARAQGAAPGVVAARGRAAVGVFDQRYAPLVVRALPTGLPTVRNEMFVNTVVFDRSGAPTPQMRFVVPNQSAVAILVRPRQNLDQAGTEALVDRARQTVQRSGLPAERVTITGTPAVAAELGSTVKQEIPILGGLAVGLIAACYGLVPWTRRRRHRLLPLAATLSATALVLAVFGWLDHPLSLGVVAFLPIMIGIGSDFPAYVVHGANRRVVVTAAAASAAGFGSLALSPLPFVRDLGLALGVGVLVALIVSLLFRRYLIAPDRRTSSDVGTRSGAEAASSTLSAAEPPPSNGSSAVTVGVVRSLSLAQRLGALVASVVVATLGWTLLPQLDIQARPDQLAAGLPAIDEALHAEEVLGSSGEIQILLRGENVATPAALAWMRRAQDETVMRFGSRLRPVVSLPDLLRFLGPSPSPQQIDSAVRLLPSYLTSSVLRADRRQAVVSFGIELQDIREQKALLDGLEASLPPPPPGLEASVVGLPVAAVRGYELISADRYLTNLAGIAAAGLVLVIGLRRRTDAGRAVLAALLSSGWGLALVWLLGVSLSPLTVALGSLTTATACEFTLLLTHDRSRGFSSLKRTVTVAAGAASLGYLALGASGLAVMREFGLLLATTVLLSLLASYAMVRLIPPRLRTTRTEVGARELAVDRDEVRT